MKDRTHKYKSYIPREGQMVGGEAEFSKDRYFGNLQVEGFHIFYFRVFFLE